MVFSKHIKLCIELHFIIRDFALPRKITGYENSTLQKVFSRFSYTILFFEQQLQTISIIFSSKVMTELGFIYSNGKTIITWKSSYQRFYVLFPHSKKWTNILRVLLTACWIPHMKHTEHTTKLSSCWITIYFSRYNWFH